MDTQVAEKTEHRYIKKAGTTAMCYYRLVDKEGNPFGKDEPTGPYHYSFNHYADGQHACFSGFTMSKIRDELAKITVYHPDDKIPFTEEVLTRYFNDLNEMGFPCYFNGIKNGEASVDVLLEDYEWKNHLSSTLTLIRIPWEIEFPIVLENYLVAMDDNPDADKIKVLQESHKQPNTKGPYGSQFNSNHAICYSSRQSQMEQKSVSKEELFDNFKKYGKVKEGETSNIHTCWRAK